MQVVLAARKLHGSARKGVAVIKTSTMLELLSFATNKNQDASTTRKLVSPIISQLLRGRFSVYSAEVISWVKGSACFDLKFAPENFCKKFHQRALMHSQHTSKRNRKNSSSNILFTLPLCWSQSVFLRLADYALRHAWSHKTCQRVKLAKVMRQKTALLYSDEPQRAWDTLWPVCSAEVVSLVKGSVCFDLKFALPPFSPPLPSGVQISKQNTHWTFDSINNLTPVLSTIWMQRIG